MSLKAIRKFCVHWKPEALSTKRLKGYHKISVALKFWWLISCKSHHTFQITTSSYSIHAIYLQSEIIFFALWQFYKSAILIRKLVLTLKWVSLAQTANWGSEIWPWYFILWIQMMLMDHTNHTEKSICHSGAFSTLCSCCSAIRQLWWVLGGRHGPYSKWL